MPTAYATTAAATVSGALIAAPAAKTKRRITSVYANADTAMNILLISGYANETQSVYTNATGGTFTLSYAGQTTATIDFDEAAAGVATKVEAMSTVTDVTVTGTGAVGTPWLISFVDPGGEDIALMTGSAAQLTGVTSTIATDTAGVTAVDEIQSVYNSATSGTFTLAYDGGTPSTDLAYNIAFADLKTALELLDGITTVGVTGVGTSGDPWIVTFTAPGATDVAILVADDTNLAGGTPTSVIAEDTKGVVEVNEVQSVYTNAGSGDFTLTYSGQTTGAIDFDETAAGLETLIEALSNVTAVAVTGTGTSGDPWIVTFQTPGGAIDEMTATDTNLVEVLAIAEESKGYGVEEASFHLGVDGVAVLPYNPAGWFDCAGGKALTWTTGSGNAVLLVGYETVPGGS